MQVVKVSPFEWLVESESRPETWYTVRYFPRTFAFPAYTTCTHTVEWDYLHTVMQGSEVIQPCKHMLAVQLWEESK